MAEVAGRVLVVYAPPSGSGLPAEVEVPARPGLSIADALRESGLAARFPDISLASTRVGVWGKLRELGSLLAAGDRVEIYRPLRADPKASRSQRAKKKSLKK